MRTPIFRGVVLLLWAAVLLVTFEGPRALTESSAVTTLVSIASDGTLGNSHSHLGVISADGRIVAFSSDASNLVSGDTNVCGGAFNCSDVFVHDRLTAQTSRVSLSSDGVQGNGGSGNAELSADGRYVAFVSRANNLVSGDTNFCVIGENCRDVFVRDLRAGETNRVSVNSSGVQGNSDSDGPSISADGRYVAFTSVSRNLVAGDHNGVADVFVRDRQTGLTTRVSVASGGSESNGASDFPSISADGRFVAFSSYGSNLAPRDTNDVADVFVHDRWNRQTMRASVGASGTQANFGSYGRPALSADGRFVAFQSYATNLVPGDDPYFSDVFVHDRQTSQTFRASLASDGSAPNGDCVSPRISADGRYVSFTSGATNLAPSDITVWPDVYLHDRWTGETTHIAVALDGGQPNLESDDSSLSADGRFVLFQSSASNLVPDHTSVWVDVFVRDRNPKAPALSRLLIYEYQWRIGLRGSLTVLLFADGSFRDSDRNTGRWTYQTAQQRYVLVYDSGQFCNAVSVGAFNTAPSIHGQTFCRDGSGGMAAWQGSLYIVDGGASAGDAGLSTGPNWQ